MDLQNTSKEKLLDHEKRAYYEIFRKFDTNSKGSFGVTELSQVMQFYGLNYNEQEVLEMILIIDTTGNGKVSFEEFLDVFLRTMKDANEAEEELREAFRVFDKEGNGFLLITELSKVLTELGDKLSHEEVDEMLRELELKNDRYINYEEFITILSSNHE